MVRELLLPPQKRIFTNSSEPPRRIVCYPLRIEQEMHLSEQLTLGNLVGNSWKRIHNAMHPFRLVLDSGPSPGHQSDFHHIFQ